MVDVASAASASERVQNALTLNLVGAVVGIRSSGVYIFLRTPEPQVWQVLTGEIR